MSAVGRRRQRHRAPLATVAIPRRSVVVELPEAPGSPHRPAPLALPLTRGRPVWQLPGDSTAVAGFAVLLAVLDLAPPGALLGLAGGAPEPALLAAVYSTRLVRVVAADGLVAHAARQAAATNALPLVVEERSVAGPGGPTLDEYTASTGLEPAVLHLGAGVDVRAGLAGATRLLAEQRPWVVVTGAGDVRPPAPSGPGPVAQGYRLITETGFSGAGGGYVLAPEAAPAALARRAEAWAGALTTALSTAPGRAGLAAHEDGVLDLREPEGIPRLVR